MEEPLSEEESHVFPKSFIYGGYSYSIKETHRPKKSLDYASYRCQKYRGEGKCKATLTLYSDLTLKVNNIHECNQSGSLEVVQVKAIFNAKEEMTQMVEDRCMTDAVKPAAVVAREVWDEVHAKHAGNESIYLKLIAILNTTDIKIY